MVMQRKYPSLTGEFSFNPYRTVIIVIALLFLGGFFYGAKQIFNELRAISEGQQILILKLTGNDSSKMAEESSVISEESGDAVTKVEFIKFRNETRKTIKDLTKDLRLVQSRLRMKQTILDKY